MTFTHEQLRRIQARFTSALYTMGTIDVYWWPERKVPLCRAITEVRKNKARRAKRLPPSAILLGRYNRGTSSAQLLEDVRVAIAAPSPTGFGEVRLVRLQ